MGGHDCVWAVIVVSSTMVLCVVAARLALNFIIGT